MGQSKKATLVSLNSLQPTSLEEILQGDKLLYQSPYVRLIIFLSTVFPDSRKKKSSPALLSLTEATKLSPSHTLPPLTDPPSDPPSPTLPPPTDPGECTL